MHRPYPLTSRIITFCTILFAGLSPTSAQSFQTPVTSPAFVENRGQITSLGNDEVSRDVLYALFSENADIYITTKGISYVFRRLLPQQVKAANAMGKNDSPTPPERPLIHYSVERVDMNISGGKLSKSQITRSRFTLPYDHKFYSIGSSDESLQLTERIEIKNVYPSIDWVVYLKKTKSGGYVLKHDFVLQPGAFATDIRIRYSDNAALSVDGVGGLTIKSKLGTINEHAPIVFHDNGEQVKVQTVVNHQQVSYLFPKTNITRKTTLDPELFWGTYLNSSMPGVPFDEIISGRNVETDSKGNIYVLTNTGGGVGFPTLNPGNGAYYDNVIANSSMQILKFSASGELLWSTFFGKDNAGTQLVIDSDDFLWITGNTSSRIPLKDNGGFFYNKVRKRFICKFSETGSLLWSTYMGNDGFDGDFHYEPKDIAADKQGRIYITGYSYHYGMPFMNPGNGAYFNQGPTASFATFITVFDASCNLVWSTLVGPGSDPTERATICVDGSNRIYLGVNPRYSSYPVMDDGGYFNDDPNNHNAAITCFDSQFRMIWSTTIPGIPFGIADVAADRSNNLFVVGASARGGFPVTDPGGGAFVDIGSSSKAGAFIMKFSPSHELMWATRFANDKQMFFRQIIADPTCEAIHITGVMNDTYTDVPTINDACSPGFYFPAAPYYNATGPVYLTFTTSGKQVYTSLTDFPYEYYDINSDFDMDDFGNKIYVYGDMRNFSTIASALKNPGGAAYFSTQRKHQYGTLLMKLKPSGIGASVVTANNGNTCGCTGSASVVTTCGVPPFSYQWSNGATIASASDLCAGSHSVRVMDAYCRDQLIEFEIPQNANNITRIISTQKDATCGLSNGEINITSVVTASQPVTYSINGGPFQNSGRFTGLPAGTYTITARNFSGCTLSSPINIPAVAPVSYVAKTISPSHCSQVDGSVRVLSVTGGTGPYLYSIDGVNYTTGSEFTALAAGKHYLYVKDDPGCIFKDSFVVKSAPGPTDIDVDITNPQCGSTTGLAVITGVLGGTGPFQYALNDGPFSSTKVFDELSPGEYLVTARDVFGCIVSTTFRISARTVAQVSIVALDSVACYGSALLFTASTGEGGGEERIIWNDDAGSGKVFNYKVIQSGYVHAEFTTIDGCIAEDSIFVKLKNCDSAEQNCIIFPNAVTPNGDGRNDNFGPAVRCEVTSYQMVIFNRYGEKIFSTSDPYELWDANFKYHQQDNSTYVYTCEYSLGKTVIKKTGSFTVVR